MSSANLAKQPVWTGARRRNEIITTDTALRFARYFGNSSHFWLNLQRDYELEIAEDELSEAINTEVRPLRRISGDYSRVGQ